jgi:hypothetical protein
LWHNGVQRVEEVNDAELPATETEARADETAAAASAVGALALTTFVIGECSSSSADAPTEKPSNAFARPGYSIVSKIATYPVHAPAMEPT